MYYVSNAEIIMFVVCRYGSVTLQPELCKMVPTADLYILSLCDGWQSLVWT